MGHEMDMNAYNAHIEEMRQKEYPMLKDMLYFDHAGATLPSKSMLDDFHANLLANVYGNPHSASPSSGKSEYAIEAARLNALRLFGANPEDFDLVFTSNTTAAIKLVGDAFREADRGFAYRYHVDAHTSLVGIRELTDEHKCLESDEDAENWLESITSTGPRLFAYPAQSNMTGRRLPQHYPAKARDHDIPTYTLCDAAAAHASFHFVNFDRPETAPDFTAVSFAKMFGLPDLGALIVRKQAAHMLQRRKYFGGGTVTMVACVQEEWHERKSGSLHEQVEDGTLPIYNILALQSAFKSFVPMFRSYDLAARHTSILANRLYEKLSSLMHWNDEPVCTFYHGETSFLNTNTQGPTLVFNLRSSKGAWVSNSEVDKLAAIKNIHLRTGGLCNPGGIAKALQLAPWELRENFSNGFRCGSENDIMNGRPTGVIRVSIGPVNTRSDVDAFVAFVEEFFVDDEPSAAVNEPSLTSQHLHVESLTIYPIKSCGGWQIPPDVAWDINPEGLMWDREWCVVKQGSGVALSQKNYPRMALIRPQLDLEKGTLHITTTAVDVDAISIPLSKDPRHFTTSNTATKPSDATVCGDRINIRVYTLQSIAQFFTQILGIPCTLARFSPSTTPNGISRSLRHSKPALTPSLSNKRPNPDSPVPPTLLHLSNESPILTIFRSSLNRLNETIHLAGGKPPHPSVFRANIILTESCLLAPAHERPWAEDHWRTMRIIPARRHSLRDDSSQISPALPAEGSVPVDFRLDLLGGCRRCQMVCIDQENGRRNQDPFTTLAKTRRFAGKVLFGVHACLGQGLEGVRCRVRVGDVVEVS